MWERKKSRKISNIILGIAIVLMLVIMVMGYLYVTKQQEIQDSELIAIANEANKESEEQKQEAYTELEEEYKKDLDTVSKYMPGIVCWGDVLTGGTASGISYPKTLKSLIEKNIINQYSFKSTLDNPYMFTRIDWESYKFDIPVVNLGTGEETTYTVMGRAGADPFVLADDVTIPAGCEPVEVELMSESENKVEPLIGGDGGINPVTINGIEGTLSCSIDGERTYWSKRVYTFTRSEPGKETAVSKGEKIYTYAADAYSDYIHVIFVGTFGKYYDASELRSQIELLLDTQTSNKDRYIVIGPYYREGYKSSFFDDVDTEFSLEFGNRYINLRKYLMNEALSALDITPTTEDKKYISRDNLPPSLLVDTSYYELKGSVYELIGNLVYERMDSLGYFDEIREELEIPEE